MTANFNNHPDIIRIGTRGSRLAIAQTEYVIKLLKEKNPAIKIKLERIKTAGDFDPSSPLEKIGGFGVFTKQIENELLNSSIDMAVHSAKDLPSRMIEGLTIGAVPIRGECEDAWISRDGTGLREIESGSVVGTGSPRRRAQLLHLRPDLEVRQIRGNIETRLKKLRNEDFDALIMAYAGLKRCGLDSEVVDILPTEDFLPAPGQGSIVVQIRTDDSGIAALIEPIDDRISHSCLEIERLLMLRLNAGCGIALGGLATFEDGEFLLKAVMLDSDGRNRITASHRITPDQPNEMLVAEVTDRLLSQGAGSLINT